MDLKDEIETKNILHWDYHCFTEFPQDLLDYGKNIEELHFKGNRN